jgi:hypothetical protein
MFIQPSWINLRQDFEHVFDRNLSRKCCKSSTFSESFLTLTFFFLLYCQKTKKLKISGTDFFFGDRFFGELAETSCQELTTVGMLTCSRKQTASAAWPVRQNSVHSHFLLPALSTHKQSVKSHLCSVKQ